MLGSVMKEWLPISALHPRRRGRNPEIYHENSFRAFPICIDACAVYSRRTVVGRDTFPCFPNTLLRNVEWFGSGLEIVLGIAYGIEHVRVVNTQAGNLDRAIGARKNLGDTSSNASLPDQCHCPCLNNVPGLQAIHVRPRR